MGEVRKRKISGEAKTNSSEKPVISEGGGLGLIPVVLIAAILAGSGCYVIKKDHAENFADIQALTDQLRADNAKTIKTVDAMKKSIDQKDAIIKELQQKVSSGNEKNRLTNDKLEDVILQVNEGNDAAEARQAKIESLEKALEDAKQTTTDKTDELKKLVDEKAADNSALDIQAEQLGEVNEQIDNLNAKIQEGASKIAQISAETVAINAKLEKVETASKSNDDAIAEIKSVGGAQLEELKNAIPTLQAQIDSFSETVDEIAATIPSETLLVTLQTTAQKASDKLATALKDISENSHEIRLIKTTGEKELADLAARIGVVVEDVKEGGSVVTSLSDSVDGANKIITALTNDIDALKKKHADLSKKISAK